MGKGGATSQTKELFEDYDGFVEKFKPKKTTDDCYTPPQVYRAVLDWAAAEYGLAGREIVRPFFPGGDYERHPYPEGCAVVDNPPFSILARIVRFYMARGIDFFLFAPALTVFGLLRQEGVCAVCAGAAVEYENGAQVNTSFVTNMEPWRARSAPDLNEAIARAVADFRRERRRELPRYEYPDAVLTAARLNYMSNHGTDYRVAAGDCSRISAMDAQRPHGKSVFGGGCSSPSVRRQSVRRQSVRRQSVRRPENGSCRRTSGRRSAGSGSRTNAPAPRSDAGGPGRFLRLGRLLPVRRNKSESPRSTYYINVIPYLSRAYHFLVRKDGSVWRLRPESTVGAHAQGANSDSIGICFEGSYNKESMPQAQIDAGRELVAELKKKYDISKVVRHKDVGNTDCPGKNFPFDAIVAGAQKKPAAAKPAAKPKAVKYKITTKSGVNIRKKPDTKASKVGAYAKGDVVTVSETKTVSGNLWGKTSKGWFAIKYGGASYAKKC